MPTPNKGENKKDFLARCIPAVIKEEGKPQDQAVAICYSLWDNKSKNSKAGLDKPEVTSEDGHTFQE